MAPFLIDQTHQIVSELKRLAGELGRPPRRDELKDLKCAFSKHSILSVFGTYTEALKAAGLDKKAQRETKKAAVETFFYKNVNDFWNNHREKQRNNSPEIGGHTPTIFIPDLHAPWWHEPSISMVYALIDRLKPKRIITLGDSYDFFAYSRFPKAQVKFTPDQEVDLARSQLETMWSTIRSIAPSAELHSILGNHSIRPMKQLIESGLSHLNRFMDFESIFKFDGVRTHMDPRQALMISDDIAVIHGHLSGRGKHRSKFHTNVVHGHTHELALTWHRVAGRLLFEMSCGYLGDPSAPCFGYTSAKESGWQRGIGYLSEWGPCLIPFE